MEVIHNPVAQNFFTPLRCQAGRGKACGKAEREYEHIIVGVYKLFNREINCTCVLLGCTSSLIPVQTVSLVVAMHLFECPSVSRREF